MEGGRIILFNLSNISRNILGKDLGPLALKGSSICTKVMFVADSRKRA